MCRLKRKQEAFEKCWVHSPLRAAACPNFIIAIHQVSLLSHAACASMSTTTTTTTTTTRDRGDRYDPMEWAQLSVSRVHAAIDSVSKCREKLSPAHIYCVNTAPIVANGSQGIWSTIVVSGSKRVSH